MSPQGFAFCVTNFLSEPLPKGALGLDFGSLQRADASNIEQNFSTHEANFKSIEISRNPHAISNSIDPRTRRFPIALQIKKNFITRSTSSHDRAQDLCASPIGPRERFLLDPTRRKTSFDKSLMPSNFERVPCTESDFSNFKGHVIQ